MEDLMSFFESLVIQQIRLSEVQKKTGAKLVYNGIAGWNLGRHLLFCSQISPHNATRDEFGTSLFMKGELPLT